MATQVTLAPGRVLRILSTVLGVLLLAHLAGVVSAHVLGHINLFGFVPMFDFDEEQNIPTWFSSMLLLSIALVLAAIAASRRRTGDRYTRHWMGLSAIFFFLSLDEATSIHELLMYALGKGVDARGVLHFAWVLVYLPLAAVVGVVYLRFLASLPRGLAARMVVAGTLYVAGAGGVEMVGGAYADVHGEENLGYALITTVEELLEMVALVFFLYVLLGHARDTGAGRVVLSASAPEPEEVAAPHPAPTLPHAGVFLPGGTAAR